jgi:methylglutaconyl-CoA hydratase
MSSILIAHSGPVVTISLNRPHVRNALDDGLVAELAAWASGPMPPGARVAVLRGEGKAFSAGADLAWMARTVDYSQEENLRDAARLAAMFRALDTLPLPLIGRVHGAALGGGAGLAAVCDIVVAADDTVFGFTEAKLGILPAVIAPFSIAKIGVSAARELFLTASRFSAVRAREIGLVHAIAPQAGLDTAVDAYVKEVTTSGPEAVTTAKRLIATVAWRPAGEVAELTTETIARQRVSAEGQQGMRAFLEKRRPPWAGGA